MTPRVELLALLLSATLTLAPASEAKVDLVTLPSRERVQLTIYNSADLTLARDVRQLTLREGRNRLQFSWANTLIDPTSLEMIPGQAGSVTVHDLVYPPRVTGLGIWNVETEKAQRVPMEITYFTSGIRWDAYYLATLAPDEQSLDIEGYVRVTNRSGEDYEDTETRLIVGKINLLDRIAELARRPWPYGRPGPAPIPMEEGAAAPAARPEMRVLKAAMADVAPKEIRKEGLSEYFLYSIAGTEDLPDGWGRRLISFAQERVPVRNLYRYEEERYGSAVQHFLSFANDEEHGLGKEPIPGGLVKVFRRLGGAGHFGYVGAQVTRYVPMGETVDLDLGPIEEVSVRPTLMRVSSDNYEWREEEIAGWDEHQTYRVEVANYRDVAARVEIRRSLPVTSWEVENSGDYGAYRKVDADTLQYTLELPPQTRREFSYRVTLRHGTRGL